MNLQNPVETQDTGEVTQLSPAAGCYSWTQCLCCPWRVGVVGGTSVTAKMKSPCSSPSEVLGGVCLIGPFQLSCEWNRAMFQYSGLSEKTDPAGDGKLNTIKRPYLMGSQ